MKAPGSIEHAVTILSIYQSTGQATQPQSMPSGAKNIPVRQISTPRKIMMPSSGTVRILAMGAIKEIFLKEIAMIGSVATCAAIVTALISAMECPKGRRSMLFSTFCKMGVSITIPNVPRKESRKPTSQSTKGSMMDSMNVHAASAV